MSRIIHQVQVPNHRRMFLESFTNDDNFWKIDLVRYESKKSLMILQGFLVGFMLATVVLSPSFWTALSCAVVSTVATLFREEFPNRIPVGPQITYPTENSHDKILDELVHSAQQLDRKKEPNPSHYMESWKISADNNPSTNFMNFLTMYEFLTMMESSVILEVDEHR